MSKINDRRSDESVPWGFVVFTDSFMSGWGGAQGGRSLYALAVCSPKEAETVLASGKHRTEMKRGRLVTALPRLRAGDHLSITDREESPRWYEVDGFAEVK